MMVFEKINEHFDQWIKDEVISRKHILLDRLKTTEPLFKIIEEFINTDLELIEIQEDVGTNSDYDLECIYLSLTYKAFINGNNDTLLIMVDLADNKTEVDFKIVLAGDCVEFRFDCDNGLKYDDDLKITKLKSLTVELVKFINLKMNYD